MTRASDRFIVLRRLLQSGSGGGAVHPASLPRRRLTGLVLLGLWVAGSQGSCPAAEPPAAPPWVGAGPHKVVTVATVTLKDERRGKTLEALVRHPDGAGPFPIVVFSHGALANKEAFAAASEHWAGHGYVVIHPNHADARGGGGGGGFRRPRSDGGEKAPGAAPPATDTKPASETKRPGAGFPGGGLTGVLGGAGRIERVKDITSVLDALGQIETLIPALKGKLNRDAIAVAGHSFGAFVAQCHGGVRMLVDGVLTDLSDPRVKCVVPISAQGESGTYGLTAESWAGARTPALHITGTRDVSAPDRPGGNMGDVSVKKVPFERSPAGGKYLLVIEGANHVSFGGRLAATRGGADAATLTRVISLVFLDAQLKRDAAAKAWLDGAAATAWLGARATLQRKL